MIIGFSSLMNYSKKNNRSLWDANNKHLSKIICLFLSFFLISSLNSFAQRVDNNGINFKHFSNDKITFEYNLADIHSTPFDDNYASLTSPATNGYSQHPGKPMLPEYHQIIQIPNGSDYVIQIESEEWSICSLKQLGHDAPLRPAQPASIKNAIRFTQAEDSSIYNSDNYYCFNLINIKSLGSMRGQQFAMLTISPVKYNPVRQQVEFCTHLSATISFKNNNTTTKSYSNNLIPSNIPYTYLIVAPPIFQESLQPFISWKRQEGFSVEEFYTESNDKEDIKAHLQQRYDDATPTKPAPLFILIVGDEQEIPLWLGQHRISGLGVHRTDLYYAEFTGDYLPDALLGRISVSDTGTLNQIIAKTLTYERFLLSDSSYLRRSLLVAGKEETPPAPTTTNGQINYLKSCIIQHDSLNDTICYYNPDSDTRSDEIQNHIRQGVGFINYTAHCTYFGWFNPRFNIHDIDSLTTNGQLFVAINNCCKINEINGDCFGEHLLRKSNGGAVGVIGSSNETLWDEDYYWSVGGAGTPELNPQYNANMEGAFDRLFHLHNSPISHHAKTQSQILHAGNWAVTASGSPYDAFYWEIYSLLGDPSLMPYIGTPKHQNLTVGEISIGDVTIDLYGTPGARVAATRNDSIIGVCTIDSVGAGTIHTFQPILDTILLTSTAQYHKPLQTTLVPAPSSEPRLIVSEIALHNTDNQEINQFTICDTAFVSITVRNVGNTAANGHRLIIDSHNIYTFNEINPQQDTTINLVYYLPSRTDNHLIINLKTGDSSTYWQQDRLFDILSPKIELKSLSLLHNNNPVTNIKPNTDYTLNYTLSNNGTGKAKELQISLSDNENQILGDLNTHDSIQGLFHLTTNDINDSLVLTLQISHRVDTLIRTLCYPRDTSAEINIAPLPLPNIQIYPNPAGNSITISGITIPMKISIYDSYGRKVEEIFTQNRQSIQYSTDKLRCGVYCILIQGTQNSNQSIRLTKKLLIVR